MEHITVLATGLHLPEGAVFDLAHRLWCAEQEGLICLHNDGTIERFSTGGHPCGLALDNQGDVWFCDSGQNAVRCFNPDTREIKTVIDSYGGKPLNRPSDLIFDRVGNLIFTCPGPPVSAIGANHNQGMVLVLTVEGTVHVVADELSYPNGLTFIPGSDSLLIAETQKQRIWCGFWDVVNPSWDTIDVWASTGTATTAGYGPDGLTVGPDGNIYAAVFGAGVVTVFDPDGQLLRRISLPGQNPTNCVFDPGGQFLIVSEAEHGELLQIVV